MENKTKKGTRKAAKTAAKTARPRSTRRASAIPGYRDVELTKDPFGLQR